MVVRCRETSPAERAEPLRTFSASYFERAAAATERWVDALANTPVRHRPPLLFSLAWDQFNRGAKFPA